MDGYDGRGDSGLGILLNLDMDHNAGQEILERK